MFSCTNCPVFTKSIFSGIDHNDLLPGHSPKKFSLKRGQQIYNMHSLPKGLYCIKKGSIKLVKSDYNGNDTIVRIASEGDILGDDFIFSNLSNEKSAIAITSCEVCLIEQSQVHHLLQNNLVSLNLLKKTQEALSKAQDHIYSSHQKKLIHRLAEFLVDLKSSEGFFEENHWSIDLKFNRDEMAMILGSAPETVMRSMSELRRRGIISGQRKLCILDEKELNNMALNYHE